MQNWFKIKAFYGLDYSGDMEYQNLKSSVLAGTTVAYGVKRKALQSITINLAKMLGIDKNYGTLEVGKVLHFHF